MKTARPCVAVGKPKPIARCYSIYIYADIECVLYVAVHRYMESEPEEREMEPTEPEPTEPGTHLALAVLLQTMLRGCFSRKQQKLAACAQLMKFMLKELTLSGR